MKYIYPILKRMRQAEHWALNPLLFTHRMLLLCTLYLVLGSAKSQTYPINVNVVAMPPYSLYLSDYSLGNNLLINVVQREVNAIDQEAYFSIELESGDIRLKTLPSFRPSTYFDIVPNVMLTLNNSDLAEYLNPNALSFEGMSRESFVANAQQLPEGFYKLKVKVLYKLTGAQASNEAIALMSLRKGQPPIINKPAHNGREPENPTQSFMIQWTNRNAPNLSSGLPSYRIQMWEMPDPTQDPNIIANSGYPPILDDYTNFTTYQHGMGNTPLTAGRSYVVRVQIVDPEGRDVYTNGGYSQVCRFTYGDPCDPPTHLTATKDARGIAVNWSATPGRGYRFQYSRVDTAWQETETLMNRFSIENTYPSAQYQMRVASLCQGGKQSGFSETVYFTTPPTGPDNRSACGDPFPKVAITNHRKLPSLAVGERFSTFDFEVTVTRVTKNDSTGYWGEGTTPFNMLGGLPTAVYFEGITINTDRQHMDEVPVRFQQQPYVFSDRELKKFTDSFDDTREMLTQNDAARPREVRVDAAIGGVAYDSTSGQVTVSDAAGNTLAVLPAGKDYRITDRDGNVYLVSRDNKVARQPGATETAVKGGGPLLEGGENTSGIHFVRDQPVLTFAPHPQQAWGFDAMEDNAMADMLYERVRNHLQPYHVPYKSVGANGSDRVIARIEANPTEVDPRRIRFKTDAGVAVPFAYDSLKGEWTLTVIAGLHRNDFSLFPYYGNGRDTLCGKLNVMPLDRKEINLVLVPLNGFKTSTVNAAELEAYLNRVYAQANIAYKVGMDAPFSSAAADQPLSVEHGRLQGEYSTHQAMVIADYTAQHPERDNTVYLFLCREGSNDAVKGHTPVNRSFGFLFGENIDRRTFAHELGHAYPLAMEHPFVEGGQTGTFTNLMDYATGTRLTYMQWGKAHNPKLKVRFGQDARKGELLEELVDIKKFLGWLRLAKGKATQYRYADFVVSGAMKKGLSDGSKVTGTSPYVLRNSCCRLFESPIFYDNAHFGASVIIDAQGLSSYILTISQKDIKEDAFSISCQKYSDHENLLRDLGLQLSEVQKNSIAEAYAKAINNTASDCQRLFNLYAHAPPFLKGKIDDSKLFNHLYALSKCTNIGDLQASAANAISFFSDPANSLKLLGAQTDMLFALYERHSSFSRWIYLRQLAALSNIVWRGQSFNGDKTDRTYYQYPDAFIVSTRESGKLNLKGKFYNNQQPVYGDSYATAYVGGTYGAMERVFLVLPDMSNASNSFEVSVPAIYCHGLSDEHTETRNFSAMMLIAEGGINSILTLLDAGALAKLPLRSKVFGTGLKSSADDLFGFMENLGTTWDVQTKKLLRSEIEANPSLKALFSKTDGLARLEYGNAWKALLKHPELRKNTANLGLLKEVRQRFAFNGKDGFSALEELMKAHSDAPSFLANLSRVDPLFSKVPNIKYTGTTSSTRVRIVDNDAIPVRVSSRSELKSFNIVDALDDSYFTKELLNSYEFAFNDIVIKPENIKIGTANKNKIAVIGMSMGGKERLVPGTGIRERMFGVMDYSNSLKSLGYDIKLFIGGERIDVPVLSKKAMDDISTKVIDRAKTLGKDPKDVLLEYDEIKKTLAYAENEIWARYLKDNGYTVIDIGNPNNIKDASAFYDMEREVIFGIKK